MPQPAPKNKRQYKKTDPLSHIKLRPDTYVGSVKKQKFEAVCVANINDDNPSLSMEEYNLYSCSIKNIYRNII